MADPGFAKGGGADHGERAERSASLNGGLGAEPPAGSRGRAPGGGSGGEAPLKLKSFCTFLCKKKWPKVKDLSENLPRV